VNLRHPSAKSSQNCYSFNIVVILTALKIRQLNSTPIITDTHTHLYSEEFDQDRDEMMQRAINAGVTRFFIPAIDAAATQSMYDLEQNYPDYVFLMMGLHPTYVKDNYEEELQHVETELARRKFYAVGEIGIDLYWDKTHLKEQQIAFKRQIQLAKQYKLPIVIHCREAFDEIFEILEEEKSDELFGIFHCFTGTREQALQAISYNMKLGIGGVVTFKNGKIDQFLNEIDLKHIVLETDSPYLAPIPYRGKRNESSYLVNVLAKLSYIYSISEEEIAKITTQNSKDVFGI
jgi:TatD DNase family protein